MSENDVLETAGLPDVGGFMNLAPEVDDADTDADTDAETDDAGAPRKRRRRRTKAEIAADLAAAKATVASSSDDKAAETPNVVVAEAAPAPARRPTRQTLLEQEAGRRLLENKFATD